MPSEKGRDLKPSTQPPPITEDIEEAEWAEVEEPSIERKSLSDSNKICLGILSLVVFFFALNHLPISDEGPHETIRFEDQQKTPDFQNLANAGPAVIVDNSLGKTDVPGNTTHNYDRFCT